MKWMRITGTNLVVLLTVFCYAFLWVAPIALWRDLSLESSRILADQGVFDLILGAGALIYGIMRVVNAHPFYQPDCANWLLATPWTPRMPLPIAPVMPVWQDGALLLLTLGLAASNAKGMALWMPLCMVAGASLGFVPIALFLRYRLVLWGQLLLTLVVVRYLATHNGPLSATAPTMAAFLFVMLLHGLRRSIGEFPWGLTQSGELKAVRSAFMNISTDTLRPLFVPRLLEKAFPYGDWRTHGTGEVMGWPLSVLAPYKPGRAVHWFDATLVALLSGWLASLLAVSDPRWMLLFAAITSLGRIGNYAGAVIPTNLLARLSTGRLIIPRYDRILITPALSALCALTLPSCLRWVGLSPALAYAIAGALAIFIALTAWPGLGEHQLTSPGHLPIIKAGIGKH